MQSAIRSVDEKVSAGGNLLAGKTARPGLELAGSRILRRQMLVAINKKMHGRMIRGVCISERAVVRKTGPYSRGNRVAFVCIFSCRLAKIRGKTWDRQQWRHRAGLRITFLVQAWFG
jgi:hypothetical protein